MMLVISTQDYENYGYRWKPKGGSEYKILGIPYPCDINEIVSMVRGQIEQDNDAFITNIIGYNVEADDYLSEFEQSQLEYEGKITFPEPTIDYGSLVAQTAE